MRKIVCFAVALLTLGLGTALLAEETKLAKEITPPHAVVAASSATDSQTGTAPPTATSTAPVAPAVPAENQKQAPSTTAPVQEIVLLDDEAPAKAKLDGNWVWDTTTVASGAKSHGHPSGQGLQSHEFTADPVAIPLHGMIRQQVWLDPKDPPKGIMLKFKLANGEEVGVYWEGEEEVFNPGENEEVWYYGLLPELGKWATLDILAEDLGIEEEKITGIRFTTFDGRALWDKTVLTQAPATAENPLSEGATPLTEE